MKHQQKSDFDSQKRIFRLVKITLCFLVIIFVVEIWVANRLATYGKQIKDIQKIQTNLILENQILENTIGQNMSLRKIEQEAGILGFFSKDAN